MDRHPEIAGIRATIGRSRHFRDLAPEDLDRLAELGRCRHMCEGELVASEGSRQNKLWIVMSGCVRLRSVTSGGTEFVYALLGPGNYFGIGNLLRGRELPTDAYALGPTTLAVLDGERLLSLLDEKPRLWRHMATLLHTRLALAMMVLRDISVAPLRQRMVRRLLGQAISSGRDLSLSGHIELHLTQTDLGCMLGTSRSRVNGALRRLAQEGLVEVGYRSIKLLDIAGLRTIAGPELFSF